MHSFRSLYFIFIFAKMLNWFTGNRAIVLLLLPVIVGLYVALNIWSGYQEYYLTTNLGFWGDDFTLPQWLTLTLGPVFALANALLINALFNRNDFIDRNTYITPLIYIVYFGCYHAFYQLDGLAISHTMLILALFEVFKLVQNEKGNKAVFNAGFLVGLASTFHPALLLFFPFLYFMVVAIRPFLFREFMLLIIGFAVPLLYELIFSWYMENPISMSIISWSEDQLKIRLDFFVIAGLFILTFLISLLSLNQQSQKTSIRTKKLLRALFIFTVFCLLVGTLDYMLYGQFARFSLLFIPVSFFLTFAWQSKQYQMFSSSLVYLVMIYTVAKVFFTI